MPETTTETEYLLGPADAIPVGEGREFDVAGRRVAVFRPRAGGVYATQADCPHRAGPLVDGLVGGTTVICPLHAWKFDLSTGLPVFGNCGLTVHTVRVTDDGTLALRLASELDTTEEATKVACGTS